MNNFRIGRHISASNGLPLIPSFAKNIGCNIVQVFLGVPHQILSKEKPIKDLIGFGQELIKHDMLSVIHGSYTINFCNPLESKLFQTGVISLVKDLNATSIIGGQCLGVIIHMGKNTKLINLSHQQAVNNYVNGIKQALAKSPKETIIILETGASQGNEVASKIEGLKEVYWSLDSSERSRVKFCIDTCHIFATGYDISTIDGVKSFFNQFHEKIGIKKIACIHFNDSLTKVGSHVDRHADITYGYIGEKGLKTVALFAKKHKIPLIMETPLYAINKKTNSEVTIEDELAIVYSWLNN